MSEVYLRGGRVTSGVVRVGDTVRRPAKANESLVRTLLAELAGRGFDAAPRYFGRDEQGRETFSYVEGDVPDELDAGFSDATLIAAARLIRRYHDATAGSPLAESAEVVCHNDLSPCNFVFRDASPAAIIDFDSAAPGARSDDIGYALFLWLNLGKDGPLRNRHGESGCSAPHTASPTTSTSLMQSPRRSRGTSSGYAARDA